MVIVARGMVCGRMCLATPSPQLAMMSPQHGGHSHSVEGLKPKQVFVFRALFAASHGYTTYSQQSTAVYSDCWRNGLENLSFCIIHSISGGKTFFLQVFKHFWRDISIKLSVYFSFVKELLMTDEWVTELQWERTMNMSGTTTFPEMPVEFRF